MIRAKDPRLHIITVAEHGFLLPEGSSAQGGATLAGYSSSQKAIESIAEAQATHAVEPALLVEPFQAVPPGEGYKDLETTSTQLSKEGTKAKPKK